MSLIMFYPYRSLSDLKIDGSFWKLFMKEYHTHLAGGRTKFWVKGFEILQNLQDRMTLEKQLKRARDPVTLLSSCKQKSTNNKGVKPDDDTWNGVPDILEYCSEQW